MRVMKWKDAIAMNKAFMFMYKDEDKFFWEDNNDVYVSYTFSADGVVSERFPITKPERDMGVSYEDYNKMLDSFNKGERVFPVSSDLDTSRDVVSKGEQEDLVVVFEDSDIDIWIARLNDIKQRML